MDSHGKYSDDEIEKMKEELSELRETNEALRKENGNLRKELGLKPSTSSSSSQISKSLSAREKLSQTYFDLVIGDKKEALGRLVVTLFTDQAPMTCAKFIKLCTHETGVGYRGSCVRRLNKTWCAMGQEPDLTYPSAGGSHGFPPELITSLENKSTKHDQEGLVTMWSNVSMLTNYSGDAGRVSDQEFTKSFFAVMFIPKPALDGKYVVIGKVTDETWSVMEEIRNRNEGVSIVDCGVVE